uniref:Chorismate synthase n=1 Tax=Mycena chlorophos TaxID=658473 RepID=A0ABQ0LKE0_MYCCL|nr:predicted protein [Mycena chlorophos]
MSTYGTLFRVTTFGESHCASVGAIIDGCPPGLELSAQDIQIQLNRRRPGQSDLTTPRNEKDAVQLQSGIEQGVTLGTPIGLLVRNEDQRPHDYTETDLYPRPSHADYTYLEKYGIKASSGGGRSSARETIGRVAAGAIAEKSLLATVTRPIVDAHPTRCPHPETAERMKARIIRAKDASDSIGGTVTCVVRHLPPGLGEPVFDKLEALLAHAMLSVPATKGFEIGSGFRGAEVPGSRHNDAFVQRADGSLGTRTNWSGGIQGGISNGEDVYFRVAFKSPATIARKQDTAKYDGEAGTLAARGRHDPCVVPRAVPIVEAMTAIVLMDALLIQKSRVAAMSLLPPITTLPPTMVMPQKARQEAANTTTQ